MYGYGRTRLCVSTFKGLQTLPLYVARRHGFFEERGLDVEIEYTSGSAAQVAGLAGGAYELIQTAPDNVVNAESTPRAFGLDPAKAPSLALLLGGSVGPLALFAQQPFSTVGELRGSVLGVDNPGSGFALVLRDVLARGGLVLDRDYAFTVSGGTSARLEALRSGAVTATLLYPPFDLLAEAECFRRLVTSTEMYRSYASLATAATRSWVEAHGDMLTSYITAILRALGWIHDAENAEAVRALLRSEPALGGLDDATVAHAYAGFVAPITGFGRDASLDLAGLEQVIALRAAYAPPDQPLRAAEQYCDLRWYERARQYRTDG